MSPAVHVPVLLLLVLSAILTVGLRDIAHSIAALCLFNFLLALEFYVLNAPDAAIAEVAIGAGLLTAVFIGAWIACRKRIKEKGR